MTAPFSRKIPVSFELNQTFDIILGVRANCLLKAMQGVSLGTEIEFRLAGFWFRASW